MPIKPENRALYPPDWPEISRRIRFERANGKCECLGHCGRQHPAKRCVAAHGRPIDPTVDGSGVVILTVAHLDHDPRNCADQNLRAFCQRCHLTYDAKHHAKNAATTRMQKKEAAGQMRLDDPKED